jgi:NADH:quinone reductase (non-electrogenic)
LLDLQPVKHVVIIGGGFGGLHAARGLRRARVHVTLVDRNNYHVFQPLLYQVATSGLEGNRVAFPLRTLLRRQANTEVLMAEVAAIEPAENGVRLANGHVLRYDYLILATGAQPSYHGRADFRRYAPGLKSLRDAVTIRYRVIGAFERAEQETDRAEQRALLTFVVIGGGPTGVELAGAIAELARRSLRRDFRHVDPTKARVILVEGAPHVLATYPGDLQAKAFAQLRSLGVDVREGVHVKRVDGSGVDLPGEHLEARTVLWAAGVEAEPLTGTLGVPLDRHGRVLVDATLHPPGLPRVFVIGDAASLLQDGKPIPGVATAAIQAGHYAARAIRRELRARPVAPFRYRDRGEVSTIGRSRAVARLPGGIKLSGFLAWLLYMTVHLLYLSGFRTRVLVFLSWAWSYLTFERGARIIPTPAEAAAPLEGP